MPNQPALTGQHARPRHRLGHICAHSVEFICLIIFMQDLFAHAIQRPNGARNRLGKNDMGSTFKPRQRGQQLQGPKTAFCRVHHTRCQGQLQSLFCHLRRNCSLLNDHMMGLAGMSAHIKSSTAGEIPKITSSFSGKCTCHKGPAGSKITRCEALIIKLLWAPVPERLLTMVKSVNAAGSGCF